LVFSLAPISASNLWNCAQRIAYAALQAFAGNERYNVKPNLKVAKSTYLKEIAKFFIIKKTCIMKTNISNTQ